MVVVLDDTAGVVDLLDELTVRLDGVTRLDRLDEVESVRTLGRVLDDEETDDLLPGLDCETVERLRAGVLFTALLRLDELLTVGAERLLLRTEDLLELTEVRLDAFERLELDLELLASEFLDFVTFDRDLASRVATGIARIAIKIRLNMLYL